jgi:hypothetical protein
MLSDCSVRYGLEKVKNVVWEAWSKVTALSPGEQFCWPGWYSGRGNRASRNGSLEK